jgi:hypothetical protein
MATDRLDKSIPRLPQRYPLTIHYYQLLFSGQLGFYLAAHFENRPNLFGVTLDDSSADESYSVFDHPTVRIFVRKNPYPYTPDQLLHKLLAGVQLPSTNSPGNSLPVGARVVRSGGGRHPGNGVQAFMAPCLGDRYARSFPLMEVDPSRSRISSSFQRRASTRNAPANWYVIPYNRKIVVSRTCL